MITHLIRAALGIVCALMIAGCLSIRTTGAASVEDLQAEDQYKAAYSAQLAKVETDLLQLFARTTSSPGACNVGAAQQDCYDADAILIADYQALLTAFEALPVPPRYAEADRLLRQAIADNIRVLELRNRAIAQHDQDAWTQQRAQFPAVVANLTRAWEAFPADNRPQPAP